MYKVLIADDETFVRNLLEKNLRASGCYPLAFGNKCALFDLAFEFLRLDFTSCDSPQKQYR